MKLRRISYPTVAAIIALALVPTHALALHDSSRHSEQYLREWSRVAEDSARKAVEKSEQAVSDTEKRVHAELERAVPAPPANDAAQQNAAPESAVSQGIPSRATPQKPEAPAAKLSQRLEDARLKACQNREAAIQNIMTRLSDKSLHQLAIFNTIADRSIAYYEANDLRSDDYDALVDAMQTQRVLAEDAVTATHDASANFDCEDENPLEHTRSFTGTLTLQNDLLRQYRASVKDLVVEIRSASQQKEA